MIRENFKFWIFFEIMNDVSGTNKIKINSYICVIDISFFYFLL